MRIGVPREIKDGEARVGLTPEAVKTLTAAGHAGLVETTAGSRIGFGDELYAAAGAFLAAGPDAIYASELVMKVKELQREEYPRLRPGYIVADYQQLARDPGLMDEVLARRIPCLGYEGVRLPDGSRPLLAPMSNIAGLMAG